MSKNDKDISISRAVGQFFGHLWGSASKPVERDEPVRHEVRRETEESQGELDGKKVVLRRTTIEEVEIQNDQQS
ncbi:MAG: hypothetical protein CMJ35_10235 [Phycisphaerae bacterium]|nr:hypothetical protein [Phycisphaerae bacterium]MBM91974.1 hypothetical protein [Phycisphaerae bacterium]HCT46312.1 hypothetical protein [Phycisphaerales bacterium]